MKLTSSLLLVHREWTVLLVLNLLELTIDVVDFIANFIHHTSSCMCNTISFAHET